MARKPFFGDLGTVFGKGVQGFSMLQLCRIWFGRTMGSESKAPKKVGPLPRFLGEACCPHAPEPTEIRH